MEELNKIEKVFDNLQKLEINSKVNNVSILMNTFTTLQEVYNQIKVLEEKYNALVKTMEEEKA